VSVTLCRHLSVEWRLVKGQLGLEQGEGLVHRAEELELWCRVGLLWNSS
jgi:hypothetical protein